MITVKGVCDFSEPKAVFDPFQKFISGEKLFPTGGRIAQGLEQPGANEDSYILRRIIEQPANLLDIQSGGKLSAQIRKIT